MNNNKLFSEINICKQKFKGDKTELLDGLKQALEAKAPKYT